jgi:small-conductance mechanosensitive channel
LIPEISPPAPPSPGLWQGWLAQFATDYGPQLAWIAFVLVLGVFVGWLGARLLRRLAERWATPLGAGRASMIGRFVGTAVFGLAFVFTLHGVGLPLSGMLGWVAGAAGIAGVAIGFASQTSASNIISGLFLLGERPFEEGDFVRIGEVTGQVLSVELLSVKLRTFDNLFVRVPNETAMRSTITNISRFKIRRIDLPLRFSADAPLEQIRAIVEQCASTQPYVLVHPAPTLLFNGIVEGGVEIQVSVWASSDGFADSRAKWAIALLAALRESGLPMVGASRTVNLVSPGAPWRP